MSKILEETSTAELRALDASWSPWTAQINRYIADGAAYARPGKRICTSTANFESVEEAKKVWNHHDHA